MLHSYKTRKVEKEEQPIVIGEEKEEQPVALEGRSEREQLVEE